MVTLSTTEIDTLAAKEQQAKAGTIGYWQIYSWLAETLQSKGVPNTDSTVLWLRGATEANAGRGAMSQLIRTYTVAQSQLRYGTSPDTQEASDAVAKNLLDDLLGRNPDWPPGQVPDITRIAGADARSVGEVLFDSDKSDTAAALQNNSAWSGALLFSLLGSDQTGLLVGTGTAGSLDTLNDVRDVLYAYVSYDQALKAARNEFLSNLGLSFSGDTADPLLVGEAATQVARDATISGTTLVSYYHSTGSIEETRAAIVNGAGGGVVGSAFATISALGPNKFLDMLMGATQGKPLLGTTTDANIEATARTFFSLAPAQLQAVSVELLSNDSASLASRAMTDVNVRAALAAMSIIKVSVAPDVAEQFTLFDEATGVGNISDKWITDRAAMVSWVAGNKALDNGAITQQTTVRVPTVYKDVATGRTVRVTTAAGSVVVASTTFDLDATNVVFGGDNDDTASGGRNADHLYGGAGNDIVNGLGGDDYLEGNAGDDTLDGGTGNDTLIGGAGADTYVIGANAGRDTVLSSQAADTLQFAGRTLTGAGTFKGTADGISVWIDDSVAGSPITYSYSANRAELSVSGAGSSVLVKDFQTGDLGISIPAALAPAPMAVVASFDISTDEGGYAWVTADEAIRNGGVRLENVADAAPVGAIGGAGADIISGGAASPTYQNLFLGAGGDDHLFAGLEISLAEAISAGETDLATGQGTALLSGDEGDDQVIGAAGDDVLFGGEGDDTLVGGAGADIIIADGNRVGLMPSQGYVGRASWSTGNNNALTGETRRLDVAFYAAYLGSTGFDSTGQGQVYYAPVLMHLDPLSEVDLSGLLDMQAQDIDTAAIGTVSGSQRTYSQLNGGKYLGTNIGHGDDVIDAGAGDDVVNAGGGNDVVFAGTGNDMVAGYDGDDYVLGGDGDDRLYGDYNAAVQDGDSSYAVTYYGASGEIRYTLDPSRHGQDYLDGGDGNDVIIAGGQADEVFGGDGDDILFGDQLGLDGQYAGDDYVDGGGGDDALSGGGRSDQLEGGDGDDLLIGDEFANELAYQGDDYLNGGAGKDELRGGGGDDTLFGGTGNDLLYGDATESAEDNLLVP